MSGLEQMQRRAHAVPGWVKGIAMAGVFLVPLAWVVGDDNLFDWMLALLSAGFGEDAEFRHLLAYLLCVVVLLIPTGIALQLLGAARLRKAA